MNKIQLEILVKLITSPVGMRYMHLKSKETESDKYNYHLKYLVGKNLIASKGNLYGLTQEGRQYVSNLDSNGNIRETFKVSVALYVTNG